jgi:TetR/AcrR family transcriptional repressor of nem operon
VLFKLLNVPTGLFGLYSYLCLVNVKHNRKQVLQIATGLFCEKGYTALGVDEILKQTGMTKGAFYNAFGNKESFVLEALSLYSEENVNRLVRNLEPKPGQPAVDRLEQFYLEMLEIQDKINHKGCLVNSMMTELSGTNPSIANATNMHFNGILKNIVPTVQQAQNEGSLTKTISTEEMAEILHSSFYGILNRLKSHRSTEASMNLFRILINAFKN